MHKAQGSRHKAQGTRLKAWQFMWALSLVLCALCLDVSATVVLPADFADVVRGSSIVVHGRVIDVRATGSGRTIQSVVTVQVIEALKGAPGQSVTFRVPNGQIGRVRRVVIGAPEFAPGDEVVVFLQGRAPAVPSLFGLSQGVYRIVRAIPRLADARSGQGASQALVMPAPVRARGTGAERVVRGDPVRQPMPLDRFASEVRAAAGAGR